MAFFSRVSESENSLSKRIFYFVLLALFHLHFHILFLDFIFLLYVRDSFLCFIFSTFDYDIFFACVVLKLQVLVSCGKVLKIGIVFGSLENLQFMKIWSFVWIARKF